MKKLSAVLAFLLFAVLLPVASFAKTLPPGFYGGVGVMSFVDTDGVPMSSFERPYYGGNQFVYGTSRSETTQTIPKSITIGYQLNDFLAVEYGYIVGDGASAVTRGSTPVSDGARTVRAPFLVTHDTSLLIHTYSIIGMMPMGIDEGMRVFGRFGLIYFDAGWDERSYASCYPAINCDGTYQGRSGVDSKHDALLGAGFMYTLHQYPKTSVRFEIFGASFLNATPKFDVILRF